jgi:hypothetical protein
MTEIPSLHVGSPHDYEETLTEVAKLVKRCAPAHDLMLLIEAMNLVRRLFEGELPGYQPLQTPYHDHRHTLEVFLCAARLIDGMHRAGQTLSAAALDAALIGALLHDVGYVKTVDEGEGSGAQFTIDHVSRGVRFAQRHADFLDAARLSMTCNVIRATKHDCDPQQLNFAAADEERAALAVASADLVGQMASREYLERLLFLYFEFREASIQGFADYHDLLEKTADFYRQTQSRLQHQLGGVAEYLALHFTQSGGAGRNYYQESIDRNIAYLEAVLKEDRNARLTRLKRGGIVDQALPRL